MNLTIKAGKRIFLSKYPINYSLHIKISNLTMDPDLFYFRNFETAGHESDAQ